MCNYLIRTTYRFFCLRIDLETMRLLIFFFLSRQVNGPTTKEEVAGLRILKNWKKKENVKYRREDGERIIEAMMTNRLAKKRNP